MYRLVENGSSKNIFTQFSLATTYVLILGQFTPLIQRDFARIWMLVSALNLAFLFLAIITSGRTGRHGAHSMASAFAGMVLLLFSYAIGHSSGDFGSIVAIAEFLLPFIIFPFYFEHCERAQLKRLAIWGFVVLSINMLNNLVLNLGYRTQGINASLYAMSGNEVTQGTNVGGTTFSITCLFLFTACFVLSIESRGFWRKIVFGALAFIDAYLMVFLQQRTTVLVVGSIFCLVYSFIRKQKTNCSNGFFIAVLIITGSIALILVLSPFLAGVFGDTRMAIRFDQLADFGSLINGEGSSRVSLALLSLETFISSPTVFLFGCGWDLVSNAAIGASDSAVWLNALQYGVGYHTDFIDNAATFGVLGISILSIVLVSFYRDIERRVVLGSAKAYLISVYLIFILLLLSNNVEVMPVSLAVCLCSLLPQVVLAKESHLE